MQLIIEVELRRFEWKSLKNVCYFNLRWNRQVAVFFDVVVPVKPQ